MKSKINIAGHPVHPMLVGFPIAFYAAATVCYVAYNYNADPFWFRAAYTANVAGVIMAILAAIPGIIDWALIVPKRHPAKKAGAVHMFFNIAALILFTINAAIQASRWNDFEPIADNAVLLSVAGLLCSLTAAFFGWALVQTYNVGIPGKELLDTDRLFDNEQPMKNAKEEVPMDSQRDRAG